MKILMLQGGFGAGGAEKIMAMLAEHRIRQGDQVTVAAMQMPQTGSYFRYPPNAVLRVLDREKPGGALTHLRRISAIRELLAVENPDLVISFLTKVNVLTLIASLGFNKPVIISERNNPLRQSRHLWRVAQNIAASRARLMVMQTEAARQDLPPRLHAKARVIPNPCAPLAFRPPPPSPHFRFVATGRLDRQKGFDLLIRAFAALPADLSDSQLTIFGDGPERAALCHQIKEAGLTDRVHLPGLSEAAAGWLSAGDALVVSSRFEGFPNVLAEATCSGLPSIAFDCPYGPSEIIADGRNGLLVPDGDVGALSAAMARLARDRELRARIACGDPEHSARLAPSQIMFEWDQAIHKAFTGGKLHPPITPPTDPDSL